MDVKDACWDYLGLKSVNEVYEDVKPDELGSEKFKHCVQAAHCMIYAKTPTKVLNKYDAVAWVLMQMRFDGHLGLGGGVVGSKETPAEAVARELSEELGGEWHVADKNLIATHYCPSKRLLLHLFSLEIPEEEMERVEITAYSASDLGHEVLGLVRVPLYTMNDGYRGFPAFLCNKFIGNSKQQLLLGLTVNGLMSPEKINAALNAKPKIFEGVPPSDIIASS